jgi:hypothetical protein
MLYRTMTAAAIAAVLLPVAVSAQSFGVATRGGSMGFGGEAAVQLSREIALRGGIGFYPFSYTGEFTDVRYTVTPPSRMLNVGLDFYPGLKDLRVGGGMLAISNETSMVAKFQDDVMIDGQRYSSDQITSLDGFLAHGPTAPYVNIGMGRHAGQGLGIFADFGAAFLSQQNVRLEAQGPYSDDPAFQDRLESERQAIETDMRKYLTMLPIFSLGIRYGF